MTLTPEARELNGAAIRLAPGAVKQGLAGLFATQVEQDQKAVLASMAALLPLLESAERDAGRSRRGACCDLRIEASASEERRVDLEERRPREQPLRDRRALEGPDYKKEMGDFGLFDGVSLVNLNMQFEQGGLRAVCRWIYKDAPTAR